MSPNEHCPLCGHAITSEELAAIETRIREEQRALETASEARELASEAKVRRELREEHERELAALAANQAAGFARQRRRCRPTTIGCC